jgi:23S rRNA-/tRNA-specific pseudouridylate synthase
LLLSKNQTARAALEQLVQGDLDAIRDGRLFVENRRITNPDQLLEIGQRVTWHAPRQAALIEKRDASSPSNASSLSGANSLGNASEAPVILERRGGILAVYKPPSWSSEPDQSGAAHSVSNYLAKHLRGAPIHVATRLDVGVSGLILVATDPESRRHLAQVSEQGTLHRSYVAIAAGTVENQGQWVGAVEGQSRESSRNAVTNFECLATVELEPGVSLGHLKSSLHASFVYFSPQTGRRHQLRIHASRHGHPLVGDRRYDGPKQLILADGRIVPLTRILLQAVSTELLLPTGETWRIHCPIDEEVGRFWKLLGGHDVELPR